jgi:pimeloyl-ACP methyl ester carboxylesterase
MSASTRREPFSCEHAGHRLAGVRIRVPKPRAETKLVFLHEGLGSVSLWRDFPDVLCARLGLDGLAYDRLGHGESDPAADQRTLCYLHVEALHVLPAMLEAAAIKRPLLVGHSDGGSIALLYAAHFPEGCAGAITEAAHVFVEEETLAGIRKAVKAWQETDLAARLTRHHGDKTDCLFFAWADTWLSPPFREWNIEQEIRGLRPPLLVLQGERDEYGTPAQVEAIAAAAAGRVEHHLLADCAHVPHHQARAQVLDAIEGFVEGEIAGMESR